MRIFVGGRGMGKTQRLMTEAIKAAEKMPAVVVTFNEAECKRIRQVWARELVGSKLEIFSIQQLELMRGVRHKFKRMFIDNLDILLFSTMNRHLDQNDGAIQLTTITGESVRDLAQIRLGAAMLWREAANMAVGVPELMEKFLNKARALEAGMPEEIRQRMENGNGNASERTKEVDVPTDRAE